MKRDPSRPKTSDLSDVLTLKACAAYGFGRAPHPLDVFSYAYPRKVVEAKLKKLQARGLVTAEARLTMAGRETIDADLSGQILKSERAG